MGGKEICVKREAIELGPSRGDTVPASTRCFSRSYLGEVTTTSLGLAAQNPGRPSIRLLRARVLGVETLFRNTSLEMSVVWIHSLSFDS